MSKIVFILLFMVCCGGQLVAQSSLDSVKLKTLRGKLISFSEVIQKDSLVLVCFWSTNSDQSISELNAINKNYEKWKAAVAFKLMAVAVDEGSGSSRVRNTASLNDWKFDVFTDINGDLRRALKSTNLPQAIIVKKNKVMYELSGYGSGTENYLLQKMQAIVSGRS